ncbi:hypothetical protein ACPVPU_02190 [Sphingomonas sp. CJ99]
MRSHSCPKCQSAMAEGFVAHKPDGMAAVLNWYRGTPVKSWWGSVKLPKPSIPIATWRCQRCGFLEQFARD